MTDNVKEKIISELSKQKIGSSQIKIAEFTGLSRPTVAKYLQILEEEGKVTKIHMGKFYLWSLTNNEAIDYKLAPIYLNFIQILFNAIYDENPTLNWKSIGYKFSHYFNPSEFIRSETLRIHLVNILSNKGSIFTEFSIVMEEILKTFARLFKLGEVQHPIVLKDPALIIIRIMQYKQSDNLDTISNKERNQKSCFFQLLAGLIENKIQKELPEITLEINIESNEIEQENINYFTYMIKIKK